MARRDTQPRCTANTSALTTTTTTTTKKTTSAVDELYCMSSAEHFINQREVLQTNRAPRPSPPPPPPHSSHAELTGGRVVPSSRANAVSPILPRPVSWDGQRDETLR